MSENAPIKSTRTEAERRTAGGVKASHTPGPWLWLQEYEYEARADDCGCVLRDRGSDEEAEGEESPGAAFYQCPLHAAAPEMAEALAVVRAAYLGSRGAEVARLFDIDQVNAVLRTAGVL